MKTLLYRRVSTDDQAISIDAQTLRLNQHITRHGLPQPDPRHIFEDADVSGSIPLFERGGGFALISTINELIYHQGERDLHLLITDVHRMGRNSPDIQLTAQHLAEAGVILHFTDLGLIFGDATDPHARMMLGFMAVIAEHQLGVIRKNTKLAMNHLRAQGRAVGHIPYGKRAVPTGAINKQGRPAVRLEDHPEEMATLQRIRDWAGAGMSHADIAINLNAEGIPTKTAGSTRRRKIDTGDGPPTIAHVPVSGRWTAAHIQRILSRSTP